MVDVLEFLRSSNAGILFSVVVGVAFVSAFVDFCVTSCRVVGAPDVQNAKSVSGSIRGMPVQYFPVVVTPPVKTDIIVDIMQT